MRLHSNNTLFTNHKDITMQFVPEIFRFCRISIVFFYYVPYPPKRHDRPEETPIFSVMKENTLIVCLIFTVNNSFFFFFCLTRKPCFLRSPSLIEKWQLLIFRNHGFATEVYQNGWKYIKMNKKYMGKKKLVYFLCICTAGTVMALSQGQIATCATKSNFVFM